MTTMTKLRIKKRRDQNKNLSPVEANGCEERAEEEAGVGVALPRKQGQPAGALLHGLTGGLVGQQVGRPHGVIADAPAQGHAGGDGDAARGAGGLPQSSTDCGHRSTHGIGRSVGFSPGSGLPSSNSFSGCRSKSVHVLESCFFAGSGVGPSVSARPAPTPGAGPRPPLGSSPASSATQSPSGSNEQQQKKEKEVTGQKCGFPGSEVRKMHSSHPDSTS